MFRTYRSRLIVAVAAIWLILFLLVWIIPTAFMGIEFIWFNLGMTTLTIGGSTLMGVGIALLVHRLMSWVEKGE